MLENLLLSKTLRELLYEGSLVEPEDVIGSLESLKHLHTPIVPPYQRPLGIDRQALIAAAREKYAQDARVVNATSLSYIATLAFEDKETPSKSGKTCNSRLMLR